MKSKSKKQGTREWHRANSNNNYVMLYAVGFNSISISLTMIHISTYIVYIWKRKKKDKNNAMAKHYTLFFSNFIAFILIFFNYFASEKWWANRIRGFVRLLLSCRHCGYFSFSLSLFAILFDVFFLVGCAGCWMRFYFFIFILEWKVILHCSSSLLTSSSSNFIAFCACE